MMTILEAIGQFSMIVNNMVKMKEYKMDKPWMIQMYLNLGIQIIIIFACLISYSRPRVLKAMAFLMILENLSMQTRFCDFENLQENNFT